MEDKRPSFGPVPAPLSESDLELVEKLRRPSASRANSLDEEITRRSKSSRNAFVIVWVLLALFAVAFIASMFFYVQESQNIAQQQGNVAMVEEGESKTTTKTSEVLDLPGLLGLSESEALEAAGHGADVVDRAAVSVDEEGYATFVEAVLTEEKSSVKNGPVELYLGLGEDGKVVMAGYRAPFTVLGYGAYSFIEAVEDADIIPATLEEAGVSMAKRKLRLPEDESEYSTFDGDGATKISQQRTFGGKSLTPGVARWEARLSYDFAEANAVGNLAYARRSIEVFAFAG